MRRFVSLYGDNGQFIRNATTREFARMIARGQVEETLDGSGRILPFGELGALVPGGRTHTTSGGAVPHQVYTTRDEKGRVDGYKFIAAEDLPVFYSAILDSFS